MSRIDFPRGCYGLHPKDVRGPCAAGVDIRPGSWDIIIAEVVRGTTGMNVARPVFIGKVRDEIDVMYLFRQYRVRVAVCDTRPETTLAKRLQSVARDMNITVWRAEYNTAPSTIPMQANEAEGVLKLDRTMALDEVHYAFQLGLTVIIPQNFRDITNGDFPRELSNSSRVPTRWMGKDCYSWEHHGADHAFHAFGYLLAAIKKGGFLAYGGVETMGPSLGLTASARRPRDPNKKAEIQWDEEERNDNDQYFEA